MNSVQRLIYLLPSTTSLQPQYKGLLHQTCCSPTTISQLTHLPSSQMPAVNAPTYATLPVPTQLCQQIINKEYIGFGVLLSKCSYDDAGHATSSRAPVTATSSLATWMEAWNIYGMVTIREYPTKARAACMPINHMPASKSLPLHAWLKYDRKFRVLAAANPTLRWDQQFSDYWLEAITARPFNSGHWPCPYCRSTAHYPENCTKSPF